VKKNADRSIIFNTNQGFSKGFNEGIKIAQGKFVMMANNDTELPQYWDTQLLETMENNPRAGIISPVYTSNRKSALRFESENKKISYLRFQL